MTLISMLILDIDVLNPLQEIMGSIPVKLGRARNRNDARQFLSQYADAAKKMADARFVLVADLYAPLMGTALWSRLLSP